MAQIFLVFETKAYVKYEYNNEIVIPLINFSKQTEFMFRNSLQGINGLTLAQVYNMTFDLNEIFIEIDFMDSNDRYYKIFNLTK